MKVEFGEKAATIISAAQIPGLLDDALAYHEQDLPDLPPDWGPEPEGETQPDDPLVKYEPLWTLNRDINQHRVGNYKSDMIEGRWWFSPDPLVFSDEGRILNGRIGCSPRSASSKSSASASAWSSPRSCS